MRGNWSLDHSALPHSLLPLPSLLSPPLVLEAPRLVRAVAQDADQVVK